jgi:hypothetical protein
MIALVLIGLAGVSLVLVGVPVLLLALMLETCRERAESSAPETVRSPRARRGHGTPRSHPSWPVAAT